MNIAEFHEWQEQSPGCGQPHPTAEGIICSSHASGLHSYFKEDDNTLYQWGEDPEGSREVPR